MGGDDDTAMRTFVETEEGGKDRVIVGEEGQRVCG